MLLRRMLAIAACAAALSACQQQPTAPQNQPDSTQKANTGGVMGMGGNEDVNAVVIGSGVRARKSPSLKGEVMRTFAQGELVKVLETTEKRESISDKDDCEKLGYPWCKVQDHEGKESWIYGKFVYTFQQVRSEKGRVTGGQELALKVGKRTLQVAADQTSDASPEGELPPCEPVYTLLLVEQGNPNASLLHVDPKKITDRNVIYKSNYTESDLLFLLAGSSGGNDEVEEVKVDDGGETISVHITHQYQDGHSDGVLHFRVAKDRLDATGYENSGPQL